MQALQDFTCSECKSEFESAAALLKHFALHAAGLGAKSKATRKLPDLHPIAWKRKVDSDVESDSGVEDVNPLRFCAVTMEAGSEHKKYQCAVCAKKFGWATDLKRHRLTHTGERPFKCQSCDCTFTRNFLLKKHQWKCHNYGGKAPGVASMAKSRKQAKNKIKRIVNSNSIN